MLWAGPRGTGPLFFCEIMNHIADLLTLECIELDADIPTRKRAFEELSLILEKRAGVGHQEVFSALLARERLGCTCLGAGVAIPHGRIAGLTNISLAVLRTRQAVTFDTPDNRKARLFFCIIIPEEGGDNYLDVLADVAALLKDREAKSALLEAPNAMAVCQFIASWKAPEAEPEAAGEEDYPKDEQA